MGYPEEIKSKVRELHACGHLYERGAVCHQRVPRDGAPTNPQPSAARNSPQTQTY